jgi:hypothetical protein
MNYYIYQRFKIGHKDKKNFRLIFLIGSKQLVDSNDIERSLNSVKYQLVYLFQNLSFILNFKDRGDRNCIGLDNRFD